MVKNSIREAQALLDQPTIKVDIPVQRAASALDTEITVGYGEFHIPEYHISPKNLYLTFSSSTTRDKHGNYDSPIFQQEAPNGFKPLWQEFREQVVKKLGTSVSQVFFGDYTCKGDDQFFVVKDEPKDCRWRYTKKQYAKKRDKDSVFITSISKKQALEYQAILDELRFERALEIVEERFAREESLLCREDAITTLNGKYSDEFDRFTFDNETFRFRQFNTGFLYTPAGLAAFDDFYVKICVPYRNDEILDAEWKEKSSQLEKSLREDEEFASELLHCNVSKFTLTRLDDGGCKVESDLIDDRTGRQFSMTVGSQILDDILDAVTTELVVVFQRKKQIRRATAILQALASKNHGI